MTIALSKEDRQQAVADIQDRLQVRVAELDIEVHEDEFTYWRKFARQGKAKR